MTEEAEEFKHPWEQVEDIYQKGASVLTAFVSGEYYTTIYYSGVGYDAEQAIVRISVAVRETPEAALAEAKRLAENNYEIVRVEAMAKIKTFDK